ncbi:hypothetical protein [Thauera aminoaromatica]|uniref:Transposase IS4 family protein n=1 Tax=Thauera aminoaromatica S2 TaxID=1234381 RepID=N6Z5X5_THASP|nr:hypothetical protein [Thauera aminoaromatica]ENO87599.1 transposase IS4 family protein [Thauera aminoaromatica S2]
MHIEGTQALALHQLYRAMDFLEANKAAIEQAIFFQVADLLSLDVEIVFYDTTSLHFEIDNEDAGDLDGQMQGSVAAGAKRYVAPRKRGYSKRAGRCAADRGRLGGHARRLCGAPLGVSGRHRQCHHGGPGQGRSEGLAAHLQPVRR